MKMLKSSDMNFTGTHSHIIMTRYTHICIPQVLISRIVSFNIQFKVFIAGCLFLDAVYFTRSVSRNMYVTISYIYLDLSNGIFIPRLCFPAHIPFVHRFVSEDMYDLLSLEGFK